MLYYLAGQLLHYHDRICFSFQHKVFYFVWYSPNYTGSHLVSICLIQHFSSFDLSYLFSYVDMSLVNSMSLHFAFEKNPTQSFYFKWNLCSIWFYYNCVMWFKYNISFSGFYCYCMFCVSLSILPLSSPFWLSKLPQKLLHLPSTSYGTIHHISANSIILEIRTHIFKWSKTI